MRVLLAEQTVDCLANIPPEKSDELTIQIIGACFTYTCTSDFLEIIKNNRKGPALRTSQEKSQYIYGQVDHRITINSVIQREQTTDGFQNTQIADRVVITELEETGKSLSIKRLEQKLFDHGAI